MSGWFQTTLFKENFCIDDATNINIKFHLLSFDGYASICFNHSTALAFTHFRSPKLTGVTSGHFMRWSRVCRGCPQSQLGELLRPKRFRESYVLGQAVRTLFRQTQVLRDKSQPGTWVRRCLWIFVVDHYFEMSHILMGNWDRAQG